MQHLRWKRKSPLAQPLPGGWQGLSRLAYHLTELLRLVEYLRLDREEVQLLDQLFGELSEAIGEAYRILLRTDDVDRAPRVLLTQLLPALTDRCKVLSPELMMIGIDELVDQLISLLKVGEEEPRRGNPREGDDECILRERTTLLPEERTHCTGLLIVDA